MEGETLPRFDSKSRMFGNVKYPREHRIPGYAQKAAFFHLEIVSRWCRFIYFCWIELVTTLLMLTFPHIPACFHCQAYLLDTIYCVHIPSCIYIQCTHVPCSLCCSRPPDAHPLAAVRLLFVAYLLAYVFAALAYVLYRLGDCYIFNNMSLGLFFTCARCACLCVCLLMPGQRWTF